MNPGLYIPQHIQLMQELMRHRILRGGNTSSLSNLNPENKRRDLVILSALIDYPGIGLILFETGCAEDLEVVCLVASNLLISMIQ